MSAIASLSLNLEVKTAQWSTGLKSAGNAVDKFYAGVGDRVANAASPLTRLVKSAGEVGSSFKALGASALAPLSGIGSGLKGAASAAGSALGSVATAAAGAGLAIAAVGVAALGAGAAMASAGMDRIDQLADASQRLGVTTDALSELRYAANLTGSSADDLDGALEKLNANLGDAARKGTPAGDALAKLGLDAKTLAGQTADVSFRQIVAGFESVPNAADRASLAMDIFGKGGAKLLNTLSSGSGTLDELAAEARKFGVSVSQVDAAKIGAAKDAMDRAGAAVEGIGNQLAVKLAPLVEVAAQAFADWLGPALDQVGGVSGAFGGLVTAIGWVADAGFVAAKAVLSGLGSIVGGVAGAMESLGIAGSQTVRKLSDDLKGSSAAFKSLPSQFLAKALEDIEAKSTSVATATAKMTTDGQGAKSSMDGLGKSIGDVTAKLKEQADTFGKTAGEVELYKLEQQGATSAQLADARAQAMRLEGLEKEKKDLDELKGFAKSYWESTRTAAEKYDVELGRIAAARDAGYIDDDTANRAARKAAGDAGGSSEVKLAGAEALGSSGAYSAVARALAGGGQDDSLRSVDKSSKQTATNTSGLLAAFKTLATRLGVPEPMVAI